MAFTIASKAEGAALSLRNVSCKSQSMHVTHRPERNFRARATPSRGKIRQQREMTWEERFFAEYRPPQLIPNKYVLVASIIVAVSLAWYSAAARQGGL